GRGRGFGRGGACGVQHELRGAGIFSRDADSAVGRARISGERSGGRAASGGIEREPGAGTVRGGERRKAMPAGGGRRRASGGGGEEQQVFHARGGGRAGVLRAVRAVGRDGGGPAFSGAGGGKAGDGDGGDRGGAGRDGPVGGDRGEADVEGADLRDA